MQSNVTFKAGNSIKLLPGFQVKDDAYFHAVIDNAAYDCSSSKSLVIHIDSTRISGTPDQLEAVKLFEEENKETVTIEKLDETLSVSVYPNPTTGTLNFSFNQQNVTGSAQLNNELGNTIMQMEINDTKAMMNISGQPRGIYFLQIDANGERFTKKIVLQ